MDGREAVNAVYHGKLVTCDAFEYREVRNALQEQAGKWIDQNDHVRASIALLEVKRLDAIHGGP
jgi:predicted thioredoxin/glutaredoxin